MTRTLRAVVCLALAALISPRASAEADKWFEIKSPNFTVWTNANSGTTRTLVWQLEQIRNVAKNLWPWMKVDLPKPLVVIAVKDEQSMKELAPRYWDIRGGVRPVSVWVTAPDSHYIAIRTDIRQRDDVMVNPHTSAYFSYANLVFTSSFAGTLPVWLSRGLSGVVSNTLVREKDVVIGAAIPWHLQRLRERPRPLRQMLAVTRLSPQLRNESDLQDFDAQSWAFVHYLMFGEQGVNAAKLNAFVAALDRGESPDAAFVSTIGNIDDYERAFSSYVNRSLYSAVRVNADMGIDRTRFPAREMTAVEGALARASFHVATRRTVEARALIDEAAKLDPKSPGVSGVEGLLLDQGGNVEGAKTAYGRAIELGTDHPYVLYRWSMLTWRGADTSILEMVEKQLAKAIERMPNFAAAHAALAEVRAILKRSQAAIVPSMHRAVALEPSDPWHRLAAARVLVRLSAHEEARKAAESALKLAEGDGRAREEAERILANLAKR